VNHYLRHPRLQAHPTPPFGPPAYDLTSRQSAFDARNWARWPVKNTGRAVILSPLEADEEFGLVRPSALSSVTEPRGLS
jgi:hypothetical protein